MIVEISIDPTERGHCIGGNVSVVSLRKKDYGLNIEFVRSNAYFPSNQIFEVTSFKHDPKFSSSHGSWSERGARFSWGLNPLFKTGPGEQIEYILANC